jgi:hypothetical protein
MSIDETYKQVTNIWERIHADVLSHVWLIALFLIAGYRVSGASLPLINPEALIEHPWTHLADKFGIPLLIGIAFSSVVLAYYWCLRFAGSVLITPIVPILLRHSRPPELDAMCKDHYALTVIASTLPKKERNLNGLWHKYSQLISRYSVTKKDRFDQLQNSMGEVNRSSFAYFRNFTLFLVVWLTCLYIFGDLPSASWINSGSPILITLLLSMLVFVAALRLRNFVTLLQKMLLNTLVQIIVEESEFKWPNVSEKERISLKRDVDAICQEFDRQSSVRQTDSDPKAGVLNLVYYLSYYLNTAATIAKSVGRSILAVVLLRAD